MANEIFINIKDLPELTEPANGEYLLLETSTGTHIIDFANFIIPTANTVITTTVEQNITAILNLSADYTAADTSLSANIDTTNTKIDTLSTSTLELSSTVQNLMNINTNVESLSTFSNDLYNTVSTFQNFYVGKCQVTIPIGGNQGSNILSPLSTSIQLLQTDIIITPSNGYAAKYNAYLSSIDNGVITLKGNYYKLYADISALSSKTLITSEDDMAEQVAIYNVVAIKKV